MNLKKIISFKFKSMNRLESLKAVLKIGKINHKEIILQEKTFKEAHSYCKIHNIGGPQLGSLLEHYLITRKDFIKNSSSKCIGDFSLKYNDKKYNFEFKASLGGYKHNKFNFGQIRLNHIIQFYFFSAYYLSPVNVHNGGELFMFLLNKENLKKIIYEFGHYSHGTYSKYGKITYEDLEDINNSKEYSLRPIVGGRCWKKLESFRIGGSDIKTIFNKTSFSIAETGLNIKHNLPTLLGKRKFSSLH